MSLWPSDVMPTIVETEVGGNRDLVAGNGLGVPGAATRAIGNAAARRRVKQFRDGSWWIPFRGARSRCSNICIPLATGDIYWVLAQSPRRQAKVSREATTRRKARYA